MIQDYNTFDLRTEYTKALIDSIALKYSRAHIDTWMNTLYLQLDNSDVVLYATPDWKYQINENESAKNHIDCDAISDDGVTLIATSLEFVYTFDLELDTQNYIIKMNEYISTLKI